MEVTQRFVGFAVVALLLIAFSSAQIIVQPGYTHPSDKGQQGYTGSPAQQSPAYDQQSSRSLADEYQRNQALQRMVENQILQVVQGRQAQQMQQSPPGTVGIPLIHFPLRPRIGGGKIYSLTPHGLRSLHIGGFGLSRHPVLLREAAEPSTGYVMSTGYPVRTQWTRSVSGGPGADFGSGTEVHAVASESPVEGDGADGVVALPEPQGLVAEDPTDKLVEPRHIGQSDDAVVGSPLDRIYYDQPFNHDQHHPMDSPAMTSQFLKTANAIGQMIDTVAPGLMGNKDPMSSMTRHQDPSGNYQQQYHEPSSHQGERSESPSNWKAPGTSSANQPMTGQSHSQQPQRSEWSSMPQNPQNPSAKAADNERKAQQAPPTYPVDNKPANNWLTAAKQIFSGQPGYQNYPPSGYNNQQSGYNHYQPGYQSYQNRPQTGGYRPNGPSYYHGSSYPIGPSSSATASASSFSNNNNYNPYHRASSSYNPYAAYNPYGFVGAVDQFGRAIMNQLPAAVNSFVSSPNMEYLRNMAGQQMSVVKRPFGY